MGVEGEYVGVTVVLPGVDGAANGGRVAPVGGGVFGGRVARGGGVGGGRGGRVACRLRSLFVVFASL